MGLTEFNLFGFTINCTYTKKNGHKVKIYDSALEGWDNRKIIDEINNLVMIGQSDEEIGKAISDFSPDIVAISVLFSNLLSHLTTLQK